MPLLTLLKKHKFGAAPAAPPNHGFAEGFVRLAGAAEGKLALADTATGTIPLAGSAEGFLKGMDD